uniref:CxxxxCH/CxxCH domain-containing protein n=1 Tax=Draconibacterium sediminis TaxID=1544798 RepID=UPI00373FDD95
MFLLSFPFFYCSNVLCHYRQYKDAGYSAAVKWTNFVSGWTIFSFDFFARII